MQSQRADISAVSFKRLDAASYDEVAERFERLTEQFTLPIAKRLMALAELSPTSQVLDIGCGTGVLCRLAAATLGPGGAVLGVDLSDGMLETAAALLRGVPGGERICFQKGDAEQLELTDGCFDAVVSLYALRHLPNPARALEQMFRVGRRGSIAVVGIGGGPPLPSVAFVRAAAWRVSNAMLELAGRGALQATQFLDAMVAAQSSPSRPTHHHGTADAVGDLALAMRRAGYVDLRRHWFGQSSRIESVDEFWALQVTLSTHARKALSDMPAAATLRLRKEFDKRCHAHLRRGGSLVYRSGAVVISARRPG
jgi:ubiquinone/menaquinone biosynthesis C-methylase UbiE